MEEEDTSTTATRTHDHHHTSNDSNGNGNGSNNNGHGDATERARQHIQNLRQNKFSIGQNQQNPLTEDLHHAVTSLSAELYTKDVHFLMELIQNAEDNQYLEGVEPALEFVLTTKDITGCGAPATLLVFNNEVGFSARNMESICSVGRSTKKGLRNQGFIGEKGIGFKSVFLVSAQPHIFSNGYQVRFNEFPHKDCGVGYIIPEWVDNNPTVADIQSTYGTKNILPTTAIILPLKPDKVEAVKKQLSEVHPEFLLFLSKIKQLSIRENNGHSPAMDYFSSVSVANEISLVSLKTESADSRIVQLSVQEGAELNESTCRYFIWRQAFNVKPGSLANGRNDVKEWVISLAFPFGERLKRGTSSVGIFAFLPTAMVTNFPFIMQADFILASSRETIVLDNKWNLEILDCVPSCFVNAITSCVKSTEAIPFFSIARMLDFLPARESPCKELNLVRQTIRTMVQAECIIPCESFSNEQMTFCRPTEAIRIFPDFRKILFNIKACGIPLNRLSSLSTFVLHSSVDLKEYDEVLNFIGVLPVCANYSWYEKCIEACNLFSLVPVHVYMELLCFIADKHEVFSYSNLKKIPLLNFVTRKGMVESCSSFQITSREWRVRFLLETQQHSWLNKWNAMMGCPNSTFFLPDETVGALLGHQRQDTLGQWLSSFVGVNSTTITKYCLGLKKFVANLKDAKLAVLLAHLVYHSTLKQYIGTTEIQEILRSFPIVDGSGKVHVLRTKTLIPASGSKWAKLFGSNPFIGETGNVKAGYSETVLDNYVDLGEVYGEAANFCDESTKEKELLDFLVKHTGGFDLPDIPPLIVELKAANSNLTSDQAILLLDWIRCLRAKGYGMPSRFIESITNGFLLKTYSGFCSPSICFLCDENEELTLLMRDVLQHFPIVDQKFYGERIKSYIDELKMIGVSIGIENMHMPVINHLKRRASFTMGKEWAIFLLHFIKLLKGKYMLREDLVKAAKEGEWLKTNRGYTTPVKSIFLKCNVEALQQITDLHAIDRESYEGQIDLCIDELELLGVVIDLEGFINSAPEKFKFPEDLSTLKGDSILLALRCIRQLGPEATGLMEKIRDQPWMKTSLGLRCPSESILPDKQWGQFLTLISLPVIDVSYYGTELEQYKAELKSVGVAVDLNEVFIMLSNQLKTLVSASSLTSAHVISTLNCMKCMSKTMSSQLLELGSSLLEEKWLKTLHGYKSARDSILFDSKWGTVAQFVDLPLIDEAFYGIGIHSYKEELKILGVVVEFSEGAHFIARGLNFPNEPAFVTADTALSLLQCLRSLRINSCNNQSLLDELLNKLKGSKWLKTHLGYRSPEESLLFDQEWESGLEKYDAPFIDESFYGNFVSVEKDDLKAIGVKVDVEEVCSQIPHMLNLHTQTCVIMRIYKFLNKFKWRPRLQNAPGPRIWIPDQHGTGGKWVDFRICVLHYRNNLFHSQLYSLDKYYDNELLPFLKLAFGVAEGPSINDYVTLWKDWVSNMHEITPLECTSFWDYISENWNSTVEGIMKNNLNMLPVTTLSGEGIEFVEKSEVFIPDDLQLKRLFTNVTVRPLFVWYPQDDTSSVSPSKLSDIYASLGVRKISETVQCDPSCALSKCCKVEVVDSRNEILGKALMKIVLGFLAHHQINMPVEERHKIAKTILDISVVVTDEPIGVNYSLRIPSMEQALCVTMKRMVLWDKSSGRLIVKEASWNEQRNNIMFITDFARTISEGILPSQIDLVDNLCKIIQMGFAFGFKEDAVDFLLMTENLELSTADNEFLNCAFPPAGNSSSPASLKRHCTILDSLPSPEIHYQKKKKREDKTT